MNFIIKLFSFLLIIPLYINDCYAQDCDNKLSIQVIDLHDRLPLSNATVEINELEILGTTDFDGNVIFENLCEDTFLLTI